MFEKIELNYYFFLSLCNLSDKTLEITMEFTFSTFYS